MLLIPFIPIVLLLAGVGQGLRAKSIEASMEGDKDISATLKGGSVLLTVGAVLVVILAVLIFLHV